MIPWILIAIAGLLVLLGVFAYFLIKKKGRHEPDYYTLFIIGITWLPLGLAMENPAFWILGLVFIGVGLANKDKWKKKQKWKVLTKEERKLRLILIIGLTVLLIAGAVVFFLRERIFS